VTELRGWRRAHSFFASGGVRAQGQPTLEPGQVRYALHFSRRTRRGCSCNPCNRHAQHKRSKWHGRLAVLFSREHDPPLSRDRLEPPPWGHARPPNDLAICRGWVRAAHLPAGSIAWFGGTPSGRLARLSNYLGDRRDEFDGD
jgi:hypothetical protein